MIERRWGVRGIFCCRNESLPQLRVAIVDPVHDDWTIDERAPRGKTLRDIAHGHWIGAGRLEYDSVFPNGIIACRATKFGFSVYFCDQGKSGRGNWEVGEVGKSGKVEMGKRGDSKR